MNLIDFTNCKLDKRATYGGSDKKYGIFYKNERYMLKISDKIPGRKRNDLNSSYSNSAYSEYIGCHILESIGLPVQQTILGIVQRLSSENEMTTYPVVICKNFIPDTHDLVEFKFIERSLIDTIPPKIPKIKDIYHILTNENEYFTKEFGKQALERYWDVFITDALLGNFDRHANNWGYLIDKETQELSLAPIYDCGSCLYPQIADDAIPGILNNEDEIQMRIDKFPTAALTLENGEKASYRKYIASFENQDCTEALLRVVPKINMNKIAQIINETPGISDIRKTFYKRMIGERYQQILLEPYLQCIKNNQQDFSIEQELDIDKEER